MTTIETRTGEELVLARHGEDVAVAVVDDRFGRIASLRLGADAAATYDAAARALGLRTLDDRVLRLVDAIGVLRSVACLALAPQLPMLAEAVAPVLDRWRDGPFAGGFER